MTRTFNWRLVFKTMGVLLCIEALFMLIPTFTSFGLGDPDTGAFLVSTILTLLGGLLLCICGRNATKHVGEREGYVIVATVWVVYSIFGMLPFWLSGAMTTLTDCWFETMSGFTTTGATVIPDVETMTHGILLWRALSQWLGGMGIIVLSVAILPMFGLGGMQLYAAEVTGVSYEKLSPRIADTAKHMWGMYILLTLAETGILWLLGMNGFDSVCHSMSTIATGGFSTKNDSIIHYSPAIQYTIAVFMFLSGINFTQLIYLFRGKPSRLLHDEETRWYAGAVGLCTLVLSIGLFLHYNFIEPVPNQFIVNADFFADAERAIRKSFFTVVSAMTSTGFAASDYMSWSRLFWVMVFFMMFTGASSGSTSGGIKWVRIGIFAKSALTELKRRIHPNAVLPVRFNGHTVSEQTISNVMAFMFFYIMIIVLTVLIFCATGVPFDEAIGTAVSGIGNVGVSIGSFGPAGTYADFPIIARWTMTIVMLIGRLEIFTVLLLFTKALWQK